MAKHFRLKFAIIHKVPMYTALESFPHELYLLRLLITGPTPDSFEWWFNSKHNSYIFEQVKIERTSGSLIITLEADYLKTDENKDDKFVMRLDNFKVMVEEWKELRNRQVPEMYFIQEDDGTVIVRESLEE